MEQTLPRIVITGVGLTAPNANNLQDFRKALLASKSGLQKTQIRHMGTQIAGLCDFEATRYQSKKAVRRGTRAGSIAVYAANEAVKDSQVDFDQIDKRRVGVYLGITEHGNVETEEEIHQLYQNKMEIDFWSHHHNPRTVANNPAGEVTLNMGITGPHYTIGAACAAGNMGLIQGLQMLSLGEIDLALAGGVSESPQTFGIYAAFKAQNALSNAEDIDKLPLPLDRDRKGIAISEGGAIYTLERLDDALKRKAKIYAEIVGYSANSDASDYVLPNSERQGECIQLALKKAKMSPSDIDLISLHATGTTMGDLVECASIRKVFEGCSQTYINGTKGLIGHAMGAAGALELAGNLLSFEDNLIHPTKVNEIDPQCALDNLVIGAPKEKIVNTILNNSFGMLGINSSVIIKKYSH